MGADAVEEDMWMTREGVLVLFHDADLNKRPIADMTHKELDAAAPKYRVPAMKEGLLVEDGLQGITAQVHEIALLQPHR
jgi:glycerophosphoryl diester phosphodiesterase